MGCRPTLGGARRALLTLLLWQAQSRPALGDSMSCTADTDCSLNGVCTADARCKCDAPWTGPACGMLGYKITPASGFSLYDNSDRRNTWNGALIRGPDGVYHLFNPLYEAGTLGGTTTMLHGIATSVTGPYDWGSRPAITIDYLLQFDGPKSVVYTSDNGQTKYSLWLGGHVYVSGSLDGEFRKLDGFSYPGGNPAPLWHNGAFYATNTECKTIYTTPRLIAGANWTVHGRVAHENVPENWIVEDSDMWINTRGHWHIINHAYDPHEWHNCSTSVLSSHFFSPDGKTWHFLPRAVQPYGHTVQYDDGSSHMFVTLERPTMYLDEHGQLTHIHLAADLVTGDEGCGGRSNHSHFGHCPCDNCKYEDLGGTTIIALDGDV